MKNVKFIIPCFFLLCINLFVLTSCEKDLIVEDSTSDLSDKIPDFQTDALHKVYLDKGLLVVDSKESFYSILTELQQMDPDALSAWEQSIGFQSMQSIFNEIVEQEWKKDSPEASSNYLKALQEGIIVKTELAYELNVFNPAYAYVLNEKGLVKIGNDIYQMTSNSLKKWSSGNIENLKYLIDTNESNQGIEVIKVEKSTLERTLKSIVWADKCTSELKNSKLEVKIKFISAYKNSALESVMFIDYGVMARCLTYTDQRWKIDPSAYIQLEGYSELEISQSGDTNSEVKIESESSFVKTRNGYIHFTPELAGKYFLTNRTSFTKPGKLVSSKWNALAISAEREVHKCTIAK